MRSSVCKTSWAAEYTESPLGPPHPTSSGVALDTTNPVNVPFYEHHGYRVLKQMRVDDALDVWCMFRPDDQG